MSKIICTHLEDGWKRIGGYRLVWLENDIRPVYAQFLVKYEMDIKKEKEKEKGKGKEKEKEKEKGEGEMCSQYIN